MSKTPEELADEYIAKTWDGKAKGVPVEFCKKDFLAGYKAGHAAGFEGAMKIQEAVTEHLEKQMVEEMYVRMEPLLKEEYQFTGRDVPIFEKPKEDK